MTETSPGERFRAIVETCLRRELQAGFALPAEEEDVVESGALDSMAWVSVVRAVEAATGIADFGDRLMDQPRSIRAMIAVLEETSAPATAEAPSRRARLVAGATAAIVGWGEAVGAGRVAAAELEHAFGLRAGKIAKGAGIESVARVAAGEDEVTLASRACHAALEAAGADIGRVDCIVATGETHAGYPSLGARLHAQLLADERCAVLDVGGACLGLMNALAVAQSFLAAGRFENILLATADVHSRALRPGHVKGEFGALFGDGASAFLLRAAEGAAPAQGDAHYRVGEITLGCNPAAASAMQIRLNHAHGLDLIFEGEALSRAAIGQLQEVIEDLELRSGCPRASAAGFATHQPNPRLVEVLARQLRVPAEKFPAVAKTCGNLGSSTCGVALARVLAQAAESGTRAPIFVASLGPGLLFGGTVLS